MESLTIHHIKSGGSESNVSKGTTTPAKSLKLMYSHRRLFLPLSLSAPLLLCFIFSALRSPLLLIPLALLGHLGTWAGRSDLVSGREEAGEARRSPVVESLQELEGNIGKYSDVAIS